ncbi:MAG: hypothetical protein MUO82_08615 [Candidatus Thermoplasmatota archaeon]|nr:hypothetical protein [Candidatus Thermoplasmatota archaeon]
MSKIIGIFGLQGSGKIMLMTILGRLEQEKGRTIYANYHLKNIPYEPINTFEDIEKIRNGVFLADELWLWIFARSSMSKINQELTKIVMLNRKRDIDIYYTAQLSREVDVLLRNVTTYFVYPVIKPYTMVNNRDNSKKDVFRLCYRYYDLVGNHSPNITCIEPLNVLGSYYDTKEEIGSLKKTEEETPLQKGIQLEEKFCKALSKLDFIKHVELIPNSGIHSSWNFDVIAYLQGKTLAFDVKGVCESRVYLSDFGRVLKDKINNAKSHNALPFIAFPCNDRVQLTNPEYWFVCPLNQYSYLLTLSSNPAYKKLVEHSIRLVEMDKTSVLRTSP